MPQQTEQENLEGKIDALKIEIESLEEELEGARKAKSDYLSELLNDRAAQERRLELLAAGHGAGTICEFTQEQLVKLNNFTNVIRGIENGIVERSRAVEKIQNEITAIQERLAAEKAVEEPLKRFNEHLAEIDRQWEQLKAIGKEHAIEVEHHGLLGAGELYETKPKPGYNGTWLKIGFGD